VNVFIYSVTSRERIRDFCVNFVVVIITTHYLVNVLYVFIIAW
jgi:hypothetical protein